jgi:golgi SNAP receptor complex member 2
MTSIAELFPKCRKLAYDARQQVAQVPQGLVSLADLTVWLDELRRQLTLMDELVLRETPAQRDVWNRKISELRHECDRLATQGQLAADQYNQRRRTLVNTTGYPSEREELLRRRKNRRQGAGEESDLQHLADESQSLEQSHSLLFTLIDQGQASLTGLVEQRQRLRGVKRVVMEMGSRLGLSQSTMRIIERRDITDAYFVAAGMVVTCLVIYLVWF